MARPTSIRKLGVWLNGRSVGDLALQSSGAVSFTYALSWLEWEHATDISRSLQRRRRPHMGGAIYSVIDNLLPDNASIRNSVAARVGASGADPFSLLEKIGTDCVGALQFLPQGVTPGPVGQIKGTYLSDTEIAKILGNLASAPFGMTPQDEGFRLSIAGAQEKTALTYHRRRWLKPEGATATSHILKPAIRRLPGELNFPHSVENEYVCLKLCAAFGLKVATAEMETFDSKKVLSVERFDREFTSDKRLLRFAQEDMCQALGVPSSQKYEANGGPGIVEIMKLLRQSDDPATDRADFLRAQIVFWLLGATDGHAKNFSIRLEFSGGFSMTPIYDVISLEPLAASGKISRPRYQMAMGLGKSGQRQVDSIDRRHFGETAMACGYSKDALDHMLEDVVSRVPKVCDQASSLAPKSLPKQTLRTIMKGVEERAARLSA